ncbi:hypothetical protein CEK00_09300 [Stenotrophomonas maltophilia]|uniref:Uncharacterized protein n=1 Tax=Stenotrophomonas maltophilia TaxID=40324 RepID=A0A270NHX6_STEMA|nr:hypothetical protein [Stenotrophomonas maltophilia]PAM64627.1 hypothetical protein CEK00_21620 [Stenotrophomonas maltophilia]PAM71784.1 hypothetical protein CEK00_09300 [Stenotrophomonas maltophilia]
MNIINIKPEHVDAKLAQALFKLTILCRLLDDKQHPVCEHQRAARAEVGRSSEALTLEGHADGSGIQRHICVAAIWRKSSLSTV